MHGLDAWSSLACSCVPGYMGVGVDRPRAVQNLPVRDDFLATVSWLHVFLICDVGGAPLTPDSELHSPPSGAPGGCSYLSSTEGKGAQGPVVHPWASDPSSATRIHLTNNTQDELAPTDVRSSIVHSLNKRFCVQQ